MKNLTVCFLVLSVVAAAPTVAGATRGEPSDGIAHEAGRPAGQDSEACSILEPIVAELLEVTPETATFRPSVQVGNDVCRVFWDIPGLTGLDQARRFQDGLRSNNEVSLTIMGETFESPEAAVVSLEQSVAALQEGITTTVGGRERTIQRDFGDWIDGLGDRAIEGETMVMVAAGGRRFTVGVGVSDDDDENLEIATEVARQVVGRL